MKYAKKKIEVNTVLELNEQETKWLHTAMQNFVPTDGHGEPVEKTQEDKQMQQLFFDATGER
jgi:hypothetical protein